MTRDEAWALLCEWTAGDSLRRHALAVEAVMRHFARKNGASEELWGLAGLMHDFDYEKNPSPEQHPRVGCETLAQRGAPPEVVRAILGHAEYTGVPRDTPLAKMLYACDELTGFCIAVALVRPSKSVKDVDVKAVRKKLKEKRFAAGVNREDVVKGAAELGVDLDAHIGEVLAALQAEAGRLGI